MNDGCSFRQCLAIAGVFVLVLGFDMGLDASLASKSLPGRGEIHAPKYLSGISELRNRAYYLQVMGAACLVVAVLLPLVQSVVRRVGFFGGNEEYRFAPREEQVVHPQIQ